MAQKILNGVHISGTVRLDFMPTHESEGIITLGRYDANASRYHNIKSYVSSTEASNYLKFSLHNGTTNTVVDVLTLNGNKNATFAGNVGIGNLGTYKLEVSEDGGDSGTADLLLLRNSNSTRAQTFQFQLDTAKDLVITGSSGSGGFKFVPGSRGTTFTGSLTAGSFIKSGGTSAQYLMANGSVTTGVASHNHDSRYTSIDASGDNYTFEIEDEGNFSGNKWYHIANINSHNGGLHIRGAILNHVENFASQKLDIAIQVREAGSGSNVEINGTVDVHHNDAATNSANKAGVRVIQTSTGNTSYQDYKVYVRTTQYSQLTLRLTQQGSVTFNTNHTSPLTSEPAPVSGGSMELDTSALLEGHHVVVDSTVKLTVATDAATFAKRVVVQDNTSTPLSSLFPGTLVVQGNASEDPIIAITDVNTANAAAGVFHQSSTSPGFPAFVINAASNGSEQPLISARTNVNNTTGLGGTEVFAVDGDGDATFAGDVTIGGKTYPKISLTDNQGVARTFSVGANNETFTVRNETASSDAFTISNANNATFAGSIGATSGSFTEEVTIADVVDGPFTALRLMNQKTYGSGTGTNEKVRFAMGISESGIAYSGREGFVIDLGISDEGDSSNAIVNFQVRDGGVIGTYQTVNGSDKSVTFEGAVSVAGGALSISGDGSNAVTLTESDSGDFTIDAPDDIRLDAGGGDIVLKNDGTEFARLTNNDPGLAITSSVADSSINLTPNGTGNVYANTDTVIISADEGEAAKFLLRADQGDDNGDDWYITNETSNVLTFKNDISGTSTQLFGITPSSSASSSIATFAGTIKASDGSATTPAYNFTSHDGNGMYLEDYDATNNKEQVSWATDGTRRAWVNEPGLWTANNLYFAGQLRKFGEWHATSGTSGEGFKFENTADSTTPLTLTSTGNATFAGKMVVGDATNQHQWIVNKAVSGYYSGIKLTRGTGSNSNPANNNHVIWVSDTGLNLGKTNDATVDSFSNVSTHLTLNASGNATFTGTLQVDGSSVGIGGTAANASYGSVVTKLDMKGGADSIIILRGDAGGSGAGAYIASEYSLYSYNGEFMLTRTNQSSWWTSPDFKLSGGNATFAGNVTCGQIDATSFTDVITNTIMTASGDLDIKTVLTGRDIRFRSGSNAMQLRVKGDATGILINDHAGLRGVSATSATATTIVAEVPHALFNAAFFDFVIKNGTNVRAGTVYACHNGASTPLVEFAETSTVDLGDTSDVTLSVVISGNNMNLQAVTTSSTWAIKSLVRTI